MNRLVILLVIAVAVTSCALPSEGKLQFISVYSFIYLFTGADLGGGCRGCAPPPRDDLRLSNTTGIPQKKQSLHSEANVCRHKCNLEKNSPINCTGHPIMHRTRKTN